MFGSRHLTSNIIKTEHPNLFPRNDHRTTWKRWLTIPLSSDRSFSTFFHVNDYPKVSWQKSFKVFNVIFLITHLKILILAVLVKNSILFLIVSNLLITGAMETHEAVDFRSEFLRVLLSRRLGQGSFSHFVTKKPC